MSNYTNFDLRKFIAEGKNAETKNESAPGFEHDCAAHVVHETYGYGVCIEGKHTLVETTEGKAEVTHYDVFFKSGETVENVPVNELKVLTSESHTHGKSKKKNEEAIEGEATVNEMDASTVDLLIGVLGSAGIVSASIGITEFMERAKAGKYGPKIKKLVHALEQKAGEVNRATGNTHEVTSELTKEETFKREIKDILDS